MGLDSTRFLVCASILNEKKSDCSVQGKYGRVLYGMGLDSTSLFVCASIMNENYCNSPIVPSRVKLAISLFRMGLDGSFRKPPFSNMLNTKFRTSAAGG